MQPLIPLRNKLFNRQIIEVVFDMDEGLLQAFATVGL